MSSPVVETLQIGKKKQKKPQGTIFRNKGLPPHPHTN